MVSPLALELALVRAFGEKWAVGRRRLKWGALMVGGFIALDVEV